MLVAICDDSKTDLDTLETFIEDYCCVNALNVQTDRYDCGDSLIASHQHYDIIFIDIYMPGKNGIQTIKALTNIENTSVIFTTTSLDHAIEAFSVNATHYLLKPLKKSDFIQAMNRALTYLKQITAKCIEIKCGSTAIPIPLTHINYIEVNNKTCLIHTKDQTYTSNTSLGTLYEQLDPELFMRAQRSYIVNMRYIKTFLYDHIILKNDETISLTRTKQNELKQQYQTFLFHLARRNTYDMD